ncbi:phage tail protein [Oceanicola sp. S124]|uniref:phage tail protein n=1 Tax=Oceanicola sp. S124 TaxID=1042378 RepID=UPI00025581B3|nr:tail fiber protein [Oceanicola sp. S124]
MVGFNLPPFGWAFCDGQIMPINQNQSLYSILGTTYGGDGVTTFALPDLRGRTPVHVGQGVSLGQSSGAETVTLTVAQIPAHRHEVKASSQPGNIATPGNHVLAAETGTDLAYVPPGSSQAITLRSGTLANTGGSMSHNNMQPFLTVAFCIAIHGLFPSRN